MITEQALNEAIAECQGKREPNSYDCIMLAAFYALKKELYGKEPIRNTNEAPPQAYSFSAPKTEYTVYYDSGTDFARAINGRKAAKVWRAIDNLMGVILAINPKLYDATIEDIEKQ